MQRIAIGALLLLACRSDHARPARAAPAFRANHGGDILAARHVVATRDASASWDRRWRGTVSWVGGQVRLADVAVDVEVTAMPDGTLHVVELGSNFSDDWSLTVSPDDPDLAAGAETVNLGFSGASTPTRVERTAIVTRDRLVIGVDRHFAGTVSNGSGNSADLDGMLVDQKLIDLRPSP